MPPLVHAVKQGRLSRPVADRDTGKPRLRQMLVPARRPVYTRGTAATVCRSGQEHLVMTQYAPSASRARYFAVLAAVLAAWAITTAIGAAILYAVWDAAWSVMPFGFLALG
jgi:hypothetical protein